MSKTKIGILSLLIAAALSISVALCLVFIPARAETNVSPANIFAVTGGAQREDYASMEEGKDYYLTYKLPADSAAVNFQRNLALKWVGFAGEEGDGYTLDSAVETKYFSLSFKFTDLNFEKFTITLESTQMSQSKAGKAINEIVFTNNEGVLKASVNGGSEAAIEVTDGTAEVTVKLSEDSSKLGWGDYIVSINNTADAGTFTNIGLNYAKYASSLADTPVMPLSFKAEGVGTEGTKFEIRELNGQSFLLTKDNEVTDDTAPVLVSNTEVKYFLMGDKSFLNSDNYTVIDVCTTVKTPKLYYYVQNPAEVDEEAEVPALEKGESGYTLKGYKDGKSDLIFFEDAFSGTEGYISVAFEVSDNNANTAYSFYEWYVGDAEEIAGREYVKVVSPESQEVTYPETTFFTVSKDADPIQVTRNESAISAYREEVRKAALQADGATSIQVGTGAYFYLPSLRPYVTDKNSGYTDLTFTIYYRTGTSNTATKNGDYDELSLGIANEGRYQFRIVPVNRAGKAMLGYVDNGKGGYKEVVITTENVWNCANLETFEFQVNYNGPMIEDVKDDIVGYRDLEKTIDDFEVIASGTPNKTYTLSYLKMKSGQNPSLNQIRAAIENNTLDQISDGWETIEVYNDKDDSAPYNDYAWNPDSKLSFIPKKIGVYMVTVEVDDFKTGDEKVSSYKLISITSDPDKVDVGGDPLEWLQDNVLSVVFLGIGVLCLIGIVVLLLVKPKDAAAVEAEKARKEELKNRRDSRK